MTRFLVFTLALSLPVLPGGAPLAEEVDHNTALLQILSLIDVAADRAALLSAGAGEDGAALVEVALDEELERYPRMRAVHALQFFDWPEKGEVLRTLAFDRAQDVEVRIAAVFVLTSPPPPSSQSIHTEPPSPEAALDPSSLIRELLADPHPEIQAAALRAAGRIDPAVARPIVEVWAGSAPELEPRIQRMVQRTLDDLR